MTVKGRTTKAKTKPGEKNKGGRPSKYTKDIPERAYKLTLLGLTDENLADAFGVNVDTIYEWKNKHKLFSEAIKKGKEEADAHIADSLYQRAKGYSHDDVHISNYMGEITITPIKKHYPPDTTACIFWLKNRQKEIWRDVSRQEHTGKDGGPIRQEHKVAPDLSCLTDKELAVAEKLGLSIEAKNGANEPG